MERRRHVVFFLASQNYLLILIMLQSLEELWVGDTTTTKSRQRAFIFSK